MNFYFNNKMLTQVVIVGDNSPKSLVKYVPMTVIIFSYT